MTHTQRQKFSAFVKRKLDIAISVTRMIVAQERFRAIGHPMHRPCDLARRDENREIFRIGAGFQSERAADVLGDDAQTLVWSSQNGRQTVAQRPRALRAAAQEIAVVRAIVACGGAARLHRMDHDPLLHERNARDVRSARHDALHLFCIRIGIGRQTRPVHRDVAGRLRPDLGRAVANGLADLDHRSALLIVDDNQLGGILRAGERLGDHQRHRLADMPHGFVGKRWPVGNDQLAAAPAGERRVLRDIADTFHIGSGQDRQHARHRPCRVAFDRPDIRKGVRRTDEISLCLAGQRRIGRKASEPAHQGVILQTRPLVHACFDGL